MGRWGTGNMARHPQALFPSKYDRAPTATTAIHEAHKGTPDRMLVVRDYMQRKARGTFVPGEGCAYPSRSTLLLPPVRPQAASPLTKPLGLRRVCSEPTLPHAGSKARLQRVESGLKAHLWDESTYDTRFTIALKPNRWGGAHPHQLTPTTSGSTNDLASHLKDSGLVSNVSSCTNLNRSPECWIRPMQSGGFSQFLHGGEERTGRDVAFGGPARMLR